MMHQAIFDTLMYSKKLRKAGFTEQQAKIQAEALKEIIQNNLATKQDLKELEYATTQNIKKLEYATQKNLKELEYRMLIKMGVMFAATITILAAIVKL